MAGEEAVPGTWAELFAPRHAITLATLALGISISALNSFMVTTALPSAVLEIGGLRLIAWSVMLYQVAAITTGVVAALAKRRLGARLAMLAPALLFALGTLCAAGAGAMWQVLIGRLLQGLGEGVIAALCYALIPRMFPARLVPKVFGVEALVWAVAAFGGPALAGWLTEAISWRAAFLANLPLLALFMALVAWVVPAEREPAGGRPPLLRLAVCAAAIMAVALAGVQAAPVPIALLLACGLAGFVLLHWLDRRSAARLLPSGAFDARQTLGAALLVVLLMPLAQAATSVYLVLLVEHAFEFGPRISGQIQAIMALSWSLVALPVAHWSAPRHQALFVRVGALVLAVGLGCVWLAVASRSLALLLAGQAAIGGGFGLSWAFLSHAVMRAAPAGERDRASALLPTVQSAGYALGSGLAGLLANASGLTAALLRPGAGLPLAWLLGGACVIALLAARVGWGVRSEAA